MHRFMAALLAVATCASIAHGQSSEPISISPPLTLEQALTLAGATAPTLQAATAGVRAAEAGRTVAGYRPNPTIVAETENVAGSGQFRGVRSAETTAGLAFPIELGGKRSARIAVADAIGDRARIGTALAGADLRLAITQLYIEAASAERRIVTAREQAGIAREALRAAGVRVQAGRASPLEQQRADVLRINAETAVERAQRLAEVARDNLARRIGQPLTGPLDLAWFDRVEGYGPARPIESVGTLALAAARADVTTAEAQVRLARSQRIPDVTLSASARRLEATNDVAAVFGVSIPFPILNNGRAAISQARAQSDQADALRRAAELDSAQAIASAEAEVANAATSARNASGPALAAATEAARIARIGYREGKFGQLDLLDAERTLSETRTAAIDALAGYHDAQARRDRLTTAAPDQKDPNR
uniref:TolC family protein n=1 Tax=uncultured Sphingomonas sp. TaxID=158754 RepID=UPI0035CBA20C